MNSSKKRSILAWCSAWVATEFGTIGSAGRSGDLGPPRGLKPKELGPEATVRSIIDGEAGSGPGDSVRYGDLGPPMELKPKELGPEATVRSIIDGEAGSGPGDSVRSMTIGFSTSSKARQQILSPSSSSHMEGSGLGNRFLGLTRLFGVSSRSTLRLMIRFDMI